MSTGHFLLVLLLVGLVQFVFCCGASAKKGTKTLKDTKSQATVSPTLKLNSTKHDIKDFPADTRRPFRCCKPSKKRLTAQNSSSTHQDPTTTASSTHVVLKTTSTSTAHNIVKTSTTQAQTSKAATPTFASTPSKTVTTRNTLKEKFTLSRPDTKDDSCTLWMNCPVHHHPQVKAWFRSLPACPCRFLPSRLYINNALYDKIQGRLFSWRIVNARYEMLSVFKPTAKYCIRQLPTTVTTAITTQQCCYDSKSRLITRGSGAGTPNLVAPELDYTMHNDVDLKPYIFCQGDWTRYQAIRRPNNGYNCTENPVRAEFWRQVKKARDF